MEEERTSKKYFDEHHDIYVEIFKKISSICREVSYDLRRDCSDCSFMARDIYGNELGCIFDRKPSTYDGNTVAWDIRDYEEKEEYRKKKEAAKDRTYTLDEVKTLLNDCIRKSEKKEDWLKYVEDLDERKRNEERNKKRAEEKAKENNT